MQTTGLFFNWSTGMEAASYLSDKAASVALVGPTEFPFEKSLGPEIGKMTKKVKRSTKLIFHAWIKKKETKLISFSFIVVFFPLRCWRKPM